MKLNDINISIENVNLDSNTSQNYPKDDLNEILSNFESLEQGKRYKYIKEYTLSMIEQTAEKEGRDSNRLLDMMVFDYVKNYHNDDYKSYLSTIDYLKQKEDTKQ
ncbi:hypothetical protein [Staphylococcus gallinarum]|uniref:hypothetical protein n=1 Tax=Staphylococcus gallinarum TaxID=1293 RepID=UPI00317B8DA9